MSYKISITLIIIALLTLLVGFNAYQITDIESKVLHIYGFCDSLAWTLFSCSFYIACIQTKSVHKVKGIKTLRRVCEVFMVLSVCPLVNEIANIADEYRLGNYIYGILVFLFYLTKYSVKYHQCKKSKKK